MLRNIGHRLHADSSAQILEELARARDRETKSRRARGDSIFPFPRPSPHPLIIRACAHGASQPGERLFADLPGLRAPPSTIPAEILDTSAHVDIVIVRAN